MNSQKKHKHKKSQCDVYGDLPPRERNVETSVASNNGPSSEDRKNLLILTDAARDKIRILMSQNGPNTVGVRISVKSGGCSGLSYFFEYVTEKNIKDEEIIDQDISLFIDSNAVLYILGTTLDYVEDLFNGGFVFKNPNEKRRCGCGKSFNV